MADEGKRFKCPICLELTYKPVVQGCGHLFCFWCVQRSMSTTTVSHCPVCQKPYVHFPRVCDQLHRLLQQALAPDEYASRAAEVAREERNQNNFSPQLGGEAAAAAASSSPRHLRPLLQCLACTKLLCRPVAMNCGHLVCRACAAASANGRRCAICGAHHPGPFPDVCLELEQFLQEELGQEYEKRVAAGAAAWRPPPPPRPADLDLALQNPIHPNIGCDGCGMMPIVGRRFHCLDCPESCGYDLCQACNARGASLPGRFNQRHGPGHCMAEMPWIMWAW